MPSPSRPATLRRHAAALLVSGCAGLLLAGCAGNAPANFGLPGSTGTAATLRISGVVHGGQNPVNGANLQLYTVGTSPSSSPGSYTSTALFTRTIQTAPDGSFSFSPTDYSSCSTATDVYLVATGGNPGGGTNAQLSLVAALGPCSNLTATTNIVLNEITTVAAAYALAPFASGYANIGANFGSSPTVVPNGLAAAFANAALLSDTTSGAPGGSGLATGVTVPVAEINSLADILAACVNTTGTGSHACNSLFAATNATDTFGAALGIAKNPGSSAVTALYNLYDGTAPFEPGLALSSPPKDFTLAVTLANGLATPYGLAVDAAGNAWVANASGSTISELSPAGVLLATRSAVGAKAVALDRTGNLWVAATTANSVLEYSPTGTLLHTFTGADISAPVALALDSNGTAWIANLNGNSVTAINSSGTRLANVPFTANSLITQPSGIALDSTGKVYVTSGSGSILQLTNTGSYSATLTDSTLQGPVALAVDPANRVYATGFTTGSAISGALSVFASGTAATYSPTTTGLSSPAGVAADGNLIWVANSTTSGSLASFAYGTAAPSSPTGGYGSLSTPVGLALDASGSLWTANSGSNSVSRFIGLATPVATPQAVLVGP